MQFNPSSKNMNSSVVSNQWLNDNIDNPKLVVLYTQMNNPVTGNADATPLGYIPNSIFFDFEKVICDRDSDLSHTMPSPLHFTNEVQNLGVSKNSIVVVYDNKGIYCAPRVWWMFKSMGHENIFVLDGGLPGWLSADMPTMTELNTPSAKGEFQADYQPRCFINADEIVTNIDNINLLDARSAGRFNGTQPEPRKGLRSGHAPNAINLPFDRCINGTCLKSKEQLQSLFSSLILKQNTKLVFSCGSGVTACVLALAANVAGYKNLAVYDGSWSEWGARPDLPVTLL